jgi:outer membrane murein-binding lipoprotein Lpp
VAGSSQEALTVFQSPIVKGLRAKGNDLAAATKTLARERDELAASIGQPVAEASAILAEKNQLLATVRELRAEIDQLRGQVNTLRAENRDQAAILKILQPEQVTLHSQASSSQAVSSPHFTENYGHRSVFVCPRVLDDPTAEDREKYPDVEKFLITFKNTKGDVADVSYARVLGLKNGKLRIMVSSVHKEAFEECIRTFGFSPAVQANRSTIAHGGVNEMGVFIAEKPAELGFAISLIDNERNTIPPEAHALLRSLSTSQNNWRAVQQEQVSREMLSKYSSTQSSGSSSSSSPKRSDSVSGDNLQPSSSDSQSSSLAFPSSPYLGLAFPSSSSPKARTSSSSSQSSSSVSAGSSSASAFSTTYDSQSSANAGLYSSSSQSSSSSNGRIKDLQSLDPKPSSAKSADSRSKSLGGTLEPTKGT